MLVKRTDILHAMPSDNWKSLVAGLAASLIN